MAVKNYYYYFYNAIFSCFLEHICCCNTKEHTKITIIFIVLPLFIKIFSTFSFVHHNSIHLVQLKQESKVLQ